ncbi:MAG TPA: thiamine-phosphate kinase, partial [Candidatus Hydrogenedentes bacterium]|nr:thiamine-phosphate kinase [Candidatus Hydrogenedentota bacterium]
NELRRLGEFGFIDAFTRSLRMAPYVERGPGDDCAVLRVDARRLLLSSDASVEDIHFRRSWGAGHVGWRAMSAALSDIAAMGGEPLCALASVALPVDLPDGYALELCEGMAAAVTAARASLVGGDVARSPERIFLDILVVGATDREHPLTRDAARPGDIVAVSGWPGRAAAGIAALERGLAAPENVLSAALRPSPRLELGMALAATAGIHAAIDISDGLAQDLGHIARQSGVCIRLESAWLPVHPDLNAFCDALGEQPLRFVLAGGEDYELAVTLDATAWETACLHAEQLGIPLHRIGVVAEGPPSVLLDGNPLPDRVGFDHFA